MSLLMLGGLQSASPALGTVAHGAPRAAAHPDAPGWLAELAAGTAIARHEALARLRPGTGACLGLFQSRAIPPAEQAPCTHGPDSWLPDQDGHIGLPDAALTQTLPQFSSLPGIPCYGSGPRVHVFYAYFDKNLLDAPGDQNRRSAILNAVAVADRILSVSAARSGGIRHIRWVMNRCHLVITPYKLGPQFSFEAFDPTYLRSRLQRAGLWSRSEKGLTFLETETAPIPAGCQGIGELWQDDRDIPANLNNHGDMNTLVVTGCLDPLFDQFAAGEISIHELFHSMGSVQDSAPHHTNKWHCWDESDVMCYDDDDRPGTFPLQQVCPVTVPELLDCKGNDYFDTSPAGGTYLATHWDSADNTFQATGQPPRYQPLPVPKVALERPGTTISGKVTIPLTVLAPGGGIESVVFTVDGHETTDRQPPFAVTVNTTGTPNGSRITVSAKATDRFGLRGSAKPITMTVQNPVVRLERPSSFASVGPHFAWTAIATPSPGHTIQKVELLADSFGSPSVQVLDTDTTKPFGGTIDGFPRLSSFAGTLRVRLTQSGGTTLTSAPRDVLAVAPTIELRAPFGDFIDRVNAGPVDILVSAAASPGLTVDSVRAKVFRASNPNTPVAQLDLIRAGGGVTPNGEFSGAWDPNPAPPTGNYLIRVNATDSVGNTSDSGEIHFSWVSQADSIDLLQPLAGATVSGTNVTIEADPTPANGHDITQVALDVDGSSGQGLWYASHAPWRIPGDENGPWDTTLWGNGPHVVTAGIFVDGPLPVFTGGALVAVENDEAHVAIQGVSGGQQVTGSVPLHAAITGGPAGWSGELNGVEFYANGRSLGTDTTPGNGFSAQWGTAQFDDGPVQVRAVARYFDPTFHEFQVWSNTVTAVVAH